MAISNLDLVGNGTRSSDNAQAQFTSGTVQTVFLSQPDTIQLQGDRTQVGAYQQQGEDLILHMLDGDAVRYQHFFSTVEGKQSQLQFVEGNNPPDRVQFSGGLPSHSQDPVTLTPVFTPPSSVESGLLAESANSVVNEGSAAEQGTALSADIPPVSIGEEDETARSTLVAPAPENSGRTPDETSISASALSAAESSEIMRFAPSAPHPTIRMPFRDGWVNNAESHSDQYLYGTTGIRGGGQHVTVVINGVSYAASVKKNGNWRQLLTADSMMENLQDGSNTIRVTARSASGRTGTTSASFIVDNDAPELHVNTIAGDGRIDRAELAAPVIISGTSEAAVAGQVVSMEFNDRTLTSTVAADGSWRFTLEPQEMQNMNDGQHSVVVTLADAAGNVTSEGAGFYILPSSETLPTLAVNTISGDDKFNIREAVYGLEIFGTSSHLAAGTEITLTLDGKTFTGAVWDNAGTWQVFLDDAAIASIADGQHTLTFTALDANGNTATASRDIWMITHQSSEPQFAVNEVTQDDVSSQDGVDYVTLSGTLSGDFPIIAATLNPGDYPLYDFAIGEDGSWSVTIRQSDLETTDGLDTMYFTVADIAGNSFESPQQVEVHLDPNLTNSLMFMEGESVLDYALLGLNTEQLATEEQSDSEREGRAQQSDAGSETLMTAEGNAIGLTTVEGGVWNETYMRTSAGQTEDLHAYGSGGQEATLADILAQHNLQVQTA